MSNRLVKDLAYGLWENEGRPDGRADEFWFLAEDLLAAPMATPKFGPPMPAPAKPSKSKSADKPAVAPATARAAPGLGQT